MAAKKGFVAVPSTLVIGEEVDRGSFGVVYLATLDKKSVAVKRFHKVLMTSVGPGENVPLKNFKTECERLKDLNHPNVVRYIGAYEDKKGPLLVMELMYESLEKYLNRNKGRLSPERILEICSSVCEGMAYLHGRDKPLIHRDLGSKNVLLTKEGVVKIADFGQSKLLQNIEQPLTTTQPGTVLYMPPEAVDSKTGYTAKVDSFSLGVLLLEICTQSGPSSGLKNIGAVIEVIRHEEDLSLLEDAHPLKPLIVWCLQHEKLRPAVAVIHNHVKGVRETSKEKNKELKANQGELQDQLETSHKEELMSLREDHDRLLKENKKLEAENSKLEVSISELLIITRQCRYRLFEEQADKQQQMESLQKENEVLKANKIKLLKSLQDQLLTANHRIEELDVEKAEAHRQVKLLQEKNEELKANQGVLQDQLRSVNQQRDQVCAEKVQLQDQVESLQVEKTHQKSTDPSLPECDEGSGYHSSPEQHRAELNGEVDMQRHISFHSKEIERTVKALEDKTRGLGYNVDACVSPVRPQAELVTSKEDLEKLLKEKEEEISCLKQTISELRQNIEDSGCDFAVQGESDEVKSLRKELARLNNENYKQKKLLSTTNDALTQLQEEKTCHQQQLQSLKEKLSRLQGENKTAKAKHVAAQSDVKPSQAQETSHEEELMSLRKDRDRLKKENKQLEAENSKLEVSISTLLITSRQHRDRLSKEQANKQQQMEPLQKENEVLKADKIKLLKTLQDQLLTANHQIEELDVEKDEAHRQVKLLQEMIEELKANQGELLDQLRLANQQRDQVCAEKVQLQDQVKSLRELEKHPSREGITNEIKVKAEWLKTNPQDKVYDATDDIDESIWPFDPNLECPHCGKRFCRGQIREYYCYHLDDEHAQ